MKGKEVKPGLFALVMAAVVTAPVKHIYAAVSENTAAYGVQTQADDGTTSGTCGADEDGANATWTLDENGVLTISGTGAIKGYTFGSNASIKEVVIEEGITEIGRYAFEGKDKLWLQKSHYDDACFRCDFYNSYRCVIC